MFGTGNTANMGDLLAPGFREIFFNKFNQRPPQYPQIVNVMQSERAYEETSQLIGLGLVPEKDEGASVIYDGVGQGLDNRATHKTYSLAYRVTKELYEDDLYGKINKMPEALGRSMRVTRETDAANIYNNGFDSDYTGVDAVELFSTLHTLGDGSTQKNELTSAADLTEDSLEQALIDIAATTDDRGLPIHLMPQKLIVPKELEWTAKKILMSTQEPSSGNNAMNPAKDEGLQIVVNHYLTAPDAWFILCDDHDVTWYDRVMPDHYQDGDFDTDDAKFKTRSRWSRTWGHPWGVFGSPGV